jgi:hypothetical protein
MGEIQSPILLDRQRDLRKPEFPDVTVMPTKLEIEVARCGNQEYDQAAHSSRAVTRPKEL